MKKFLLFFLLTCTLIASQFTAYTEELHPYNFTDSTSVSGFSTRVLKELLSRNNTPITEENIILSSWSRSYQQAQNNPNGILYSTVRNSQRESLFKWVGPVSTMTIRVLGKKNPQRKKIETVDDLKPYLIGTMINTGTEKKLLELGFKLEQLDRFLDLRAQILKLANERIDFIVFAIPDIDYQIEQTGLDPNDFEVVYVLEEVYLYFAFNPKTPDETIATLNRILQEMAEDGTLEKIATTCGASGIALLPPKNTD